MNLETIAQDPVALSTVLLLVVSFAYNLVMTFTYEGRVWAAMKDKAYPAANYLAQRETMYTIWSVGLLICIFLFVISLS